MLLCSVPFSAIKIMSFTNCCLLSKIAIIIWDHVPIPVSYLLQILKQSNAISFFACYIWTCTNYHSFLYFILFDILTYVFFVNLVRLSLDNKGILHFTLLLFMFSRVGNPFLIFWLSYHVSSTKKIHVNFRYRRYLKILLIVSYKFVKWMNEWTDTSLLYRLYFSHYSCSRGRGIHFWYCYLASMFRCPRKFRSTSGTGGTDDSVLWIFKLSSVFMFSRSRNPLLAFLLGFHVWVTYWPWKTR